MSPPECRAKMGNPREALQESGLERTTDKLPEQSMSTRWRAKQFPLLIPTIECSHTVERMGEDRREAKLITPIECTHTVERNGEGGREATMNTVHWHL